MKNIKELLQQGLTDNQLDISPAMVDQLLAFIQLLEKWNSVFNLTAIRDPKDMVMLHIVDSLSINRFLRGDRLIDVGSGGGLPGIPLAIIHPEKKFVLLDSNSKKTNFLTQAMLDLKLKNVEVVHSRVEDYKPEQGFDTIITRAFSTLKDMLQVTAHLANKEGLFLAMKGTYPEQEIIEIPETFRVLSVHALRVNGLDAERHLVCLEKF